MKIAFFELEKHEKEFLKKRIKADMFSCHLTPSNAQKFKDYDVVAVFIHKKITKSVLSKLKKVKLIATMSTGYDHIDGEECKRRGIKIAYVPYYGENTVAEQAFGLILTISRRLEDAVSRVRNGSFSVSGLTGFDLNKKTIGIIGTGNIGKHMVRIANGFGMNVIAYDLFKDKKLEKQLGFRYTSFIELLATSDIISLHIPYNKNTHHVINRKKIYKMKKGCVLINTARGGLIETDALVEGLNKKIIGAAGLDVLEEENFIGDEIKLLKSNINKEELNVVFENNILIKRKNVVITPHNAFNTKEAIERILETTVYNIKSFIKHKKVNLVSN